MRLFLCLVFLSWGLSHCFPVENMDLDTEWKQWKLTYGKNYPKEEEPLRRQAWETNMKLINDHNAMYHEGKCTYKMKMNFFGDRGNCGSCWTYGITGSLEGQVFLKTGQLVELSKQQLLNCSGLKGCDGANPISAFRYVLRHNHLDTEECYPYEGKKGMSCCFIHNCSIPINMTDYVILPSEDEQRLMQAVATVGPVTVGITAHPSFLFYNSGIYYDPYCSRENLDHAVLVVGYEYEESKDEDEEKEKEDYWIIKNSWGKEWGKLGYMRIAKDKGNNCDIDSYAIYPVL